MPAGAAIDSHAPTAANHRERVTTTAPTPGDLPRQGHTPSVAIIDIDNIAIGADGRVVPDIAFAALAEVHGRTRSAEVSLALVSPSVAAALGPQLWFLFRGWTLRVADRGKDAADHELLGFARAAVRTRGKCSVIVASGDGIFADLARDEEVAVLDVVLPVGHKGVSRRLRGYRRRVVRPGHALAA